MTRPSRFVDLLAITSRLISCMEREIELLRGFKPAEMRRLQQDKTVLADAYRAFAMVMKEPDTSAELVNEGLRHELTEATERLQATLGDNLRALKAMRDVNERVMRAVVQALDEPRSESAGYTRRGSLRRSRRLAIGPVAIQQRA